MSLIEAYIRPVVFSKIARKTLFLYSSQILVMLLGIVTVTLNTRILGPEKYGILSFFMTIVGFSLLFFRFGFFSSGGVLLAQEKKEEKEKEIIGSLTVIGFLIGLSFAIFIFFFSFLVDNIFNTKVKLIFQLFSPLLIVLPFQMLIIQIGRGTNKIEKLS